MTTKQVFLTLSCLLLLVIAGQLSIVRAQESIQTQQDSERHQNISRHIWHGSGRSIANDTLLRDPAFRAAFGVSDETYQQILENARDKVSIPENPEFRKVVQEFEDTREALTGSRYMMGQPLNMRDGDEERMKLFNRSRELQEKMQTMASEASFLYDRLYGAAFEDALSPELKQKIGEAWLAAMGETESFSPSLFEVLNLTDTQKEGMERIKKELEPEFEKYLEIFGNNAAKITKMVDDWLSRPEVQRAFSDSGLSLNVWLRQEEPEFGRLVDESRASRMAFITLFRTRMHDILTDGQRRRLQELSDNPPPYALYLIQRLRRERGRHEEVAINQSGKSDRAGADKDIWIPGPNAWRPGDPLLPGAHRLERSSPFPRGEN